MQIVLASEVEVLSVPVGVRRMSLTVACEV